MASGSNQGSQKEYIVRVPKLSKKKYHMMRFNADLGTDFFKSWNQCKIERENNIKEFRTDEEIPKFGAGSEFGREQKEQARRIRRGINIKKYKPENQPWLLTVGGKGNKKYKGIREGGVADNTAWYVFMQGKDGAFEAYPVDEWYNFQPINRYKALTAEEAEKEFERRDKIMNFFQVMLDKKYKKEDNDPEEETSKKKGPSYKKFILSEMDDWDSDGDEDEDADDDDKMDGDQDDSEKKKKKKPTKKGKKSQGGKKKQKQEDDSDNSCIEESDDYDEGAEHDYISSDSSDSEKEDVDKVMKDLAGVEEGDALRKLLASDEEDEDDKEKEKEEDENNKEEEEKEEDKKRKKKKKKKDKKPDNAESEYSSESSSDESKKKKNKSEGSDRKKAVNDLKKRARENPHEMAPPPPSKRLRTDVNSTAGPSSDNNGVSEDSIRRYLLRKPMTTKELLQKFKSKKTGLSSEELVQSIALILKRINPVKQMVKGKLYLSIKT